MPTSREIGEPERRAVSELRPFRYAAAYAGTYTALSVKAYDDKTNADVTATVWPGGATATRTSGVISTNAPAALQAEQVLRVHFLFAVDGLAYDEYRRVICEL